MLPVPAPATAQPPDQANGAQAHWPKPAAVSNGAKTADQSRTLDANSNPVTKKPIWYKVCSSAAERFALKPLPFPARHGLSHSSYQAWPHSYSWHAWLSLRKPGLEDIALLLLYPFAAD